MRLVILVQPHKRRNAAPAGESNSYVPPVIEVFPIEDERPENERQGSRAENLVEVDVALVDNDSGKIINGSRDVQGWGLADQQHQNRQEKKTGC